MLPAIRGVIDRRMLVNYRIEPDAMADRLPNRFEPETVDGWAIGGICLIRFRDMRPRFVPRAFGTRSENAAHRIAVEVDGESAVYVPRRDTNSRLNTLAGGRLFPGEQHRATFEVTEFAGRYDVAVESEDGEARIHVAGELADALPEESIFDSVEDASAFFRCGSTGYSPTRSGDEFEALDVESYDWSVEPLAVDALDSSYFDAFPDDAVTFDHAMLMADVRQEWRAGQSLCCQPAAD